MTDRNLDALLADVAADRAAVRGSAVLSFEGLQQAEAVRAAVPCKFVHGEIFAEDDVAVRE